MYVTGMKREEYACNICIEILHFPSYLLRVLRRQSLAPCIPQPPLGRPETRTDQGVRGYVTS